MTKRNATVLAVLSTAVFFAVALLAVLFVADVAAAEPASTELLRLVVEEDSTLEADTVAWDSGS